MTHKLISSSIVQNIFLLSAIIEVHEWNISTLSNQLREEIQTCGNSLFSIQTWNPIFKCGKCNFTQISVKLMHILMIAHLLENRWGISIHNVNHILYIFGKVSPWITFNSYHFFFTISKASLDIKIYMNLCYLICKLHILFTVK